MADDPVTEETLCPFCGEMRLVTDNMCFTCSVLPLGDFKELLGGFERDKKDASLQELLDCGYEILNSIDQLHNTMVHNG